jgi:Fur family ferric uptake transcriptional regulator
MNDDFSLGSVEVAQTPQQRFEEYLQSRSQRNTRQRKLIVEQVFGRHEHFDADELLASLVTESGKPEVSRATVYRTLGELVEAGLLREMELAGRTVYEHDYGYPQHDHLHCTDCNRLIEFSSAEIARIRDAVGQEHQFRVTGHRLIISGVCRDCLAKRSRKHSRLDRI